MILIKNVLLLLAIGYLLVCLVFYIFQRKFLFFPQPASSVLTKANEVEEIQFDHKGQSLSGWVVNPRQSNALIYYGGNAGAIETNIEFLRQAAPQYSIYLIPYRGYGNNIGIPTEKKLYSDALYIYDQLMDKHQTIALMGRSLGSGVASYVANRRLVKKLILSTPFDSLQNVAKQHYPFLPVSLLMKDKFLSSERAATIDVETLILIAQNDLIIKRERTENLIKQFDPELVTKVVIDGAGHNDISTFERYEESIRTFLKIENPQGVPIRN